MIDELTRERLTGWVEDFAAGDGLAGYPADVAAVAPSLLLAWLVAACEHRDVDPEDVEADDLRQALLGTVARLDVAAGVHDHVPALCRDLLAELEAAGRWQDGRAAGLLVAALRPAYERAVRNEPEPLTRPGSKLGRNDPCPCGSGRKFKHCCLKR